VGLDGVPKCWKMRSSEGRGRLPSGFGSKRHLGSEGALCRRCQVYFVSQVR